MLLPVLFAFPRVLAFFPMREVKARSKESGMQWIQLLSIAAEIGTELQREIGGGERWVAARFKRSINLLAREREEEGRGYL